MTSREIKFRAWDGEMMRQMLEIVDNHVSLHDVQSGKGPSVVMQFTGLHDKNGKEIYEGDVFGEYGGDTERPNEYEIHGHVIFDTDLGAFVILEANKGWEYLPTYLRKSWTAHEVIGNIYENPELIKGV